MTDPYDILYVLLGALLVLGIVVWRKAWPSAQVTHDLVELMNTKGGIIILLWITSMIFFFVGMKMVYWGVNRMLEGKLSTDNALILSAFNWITGSAFGGAFGALLKTMVGEDVTVKKSAAVTVTRTETET
jgi:uncharacterized membrane protein